MVKGQDRGNNEGREIQIIISWGLGVRNKIASLSILLRMSLHLFPLIMPNFLEFPGLSSLQLGKS